MSNSSNSTKNHSVRSLSKIIIILGFVSFFTDISSEMVIPLIPLFLVSEFGAPYTFVGLVEGVAEATSNIMKGFSGILSDRVKSKRSLIAVGYGLSSISKPIIAFATGPFIVLGARFGDRMGKGIRTSPRDHLMSDASTQENRGLAFGFHRTMDTSGALIGSLVALFALVIFYNTTNIYRILFLISFIPALIGVLFIFLIKEENRDDKENESKSKTNNKLTMPFYLFLIIAISIYFVQISTGFLVLKAENVFKSHNPSWWTFKFGVLNSVILTLISYVIFNIFYASSSTYLGKLSDKYGRLHILTFGILILVIVFQLFSFADKIGIPELVILAWILFGFYMASTEGVAKAFVADITPKEIRGTSYGIFNFCIGITALISALLFGFLWDSINSDFAFNLFSFLCLIPLFGLIFYSNSSLNPKKFKQSLLD